MDRCRIYTRYSSDHQKEESIEAQIRACEEYAARHGLVITGTYEDRAVSAKNDKRPEFQRMMRDAESGDFQVVLVHKYNRFARRMTDHVKYEERLNSVGVSLIAVAEDFGTGKEAIIMKSLMRSLSEYYLVDLGDEVKKGHREVALKGLHNGGYPPFGYDVVNQEYIINEVEAGYVKKMYQCAANREGFKDLIAEMNAAGICGKRGKPFRYSSIYEILRNEKYTGVYIYSPQEESNRADRRQKPNAIRLENALPVIIDRGLWEEVQTVMNGRKQTGAKGEYLCSGLVYCGNCGAKMHAITTHRKGHEYKKYYCSARCGAKMTNVDYIDAVVTGYLDNLLSESNQHKIVCALHLYAAGEKARTVDFNAGIRSQIAQKERQMTALIGNLSAGVLPPEVVADIGERIKSLKLEIASLQEAKPPKDYTNDEIIRWLNSLREEENRKKAVQLLVDKITIKKTDANVESTLTSVLSKIGCGGRI